MPLEFTTNNQGWVVKVTNPQPITEAAERFLRFVEERECGQGTPCRVWTGSPRFRVDDETVTTPRRFLCGLAGLELQPGMRLKAICGTPNCVSLGHIGW
jgi:hypothetical protein